METDRWRPKSVLMPGVNLRGDIIADGLKPVLSMQCVNINLMLRIVSLPPATICFYMPALSRSLPVICSRTRKRDATIR